MNVHIGCEFQFETRYPTAVVLQVQPRPDALHRVLRENLTTDPARSFRPYRDQQNNVCQRFTMLPGTLHLRYDATMETTADPDPWVPDAPHVQADDLPDEALIYMLPSRFCLSDVLTDDAWKLFGATPNGWPRVQAICDWVHENIRFEYGTTGTTTTAEDVFKSRVGVCRDFAHLGITFCRAMNIPARYTFGYLPDIGVPPPDLPMDFCAWFEAYLGDRWYPFDPRNNQRRIGRIIVGQGRDALDVAMITSHGPARLAQMKVWADEVP